MVAKITSPNSIRRALNYNEKKVQKGQAQCIHAGNFLKDSGEMKFQEKLKRFTDLIELNERTRKSNTLHISLNFHPTENFSQDKLIDVAATYMSKIGFGKQPYLLYQHNDAGHPHIHIVTTNIRQDGKRIDTFNIGRNQSENARKEIEELYGLVKASGRKQVAETIEPANVQRAMYGKSETKRAITNVLDAVINHFNYTSLPELNAVLGLYNVVADRGREGGRIYNSKGLLYKMLDENRNTVGVPIKASSIYSKPTLQVLEKNFIRNEMNRLPSRQKLKTAIEWIIAKQPVSLKDFTNQLRKEKIYTVLRQNKTGLVYGITFIDFRTKSVFNGSDLGKQYSIASLQQRIAGVSPSVTKPAIPSSPVLSHEPHRMMEDKEKEKINDQQNDKLDLMVQVMQAEKNYGRIPVGLLKKKKKKRRTSQ